MQENTPQLPLILYHKDHTDSVAAALMGYIHFNGKCEMKALFNDGILTDMEDRDVYVINFYLLPDFLLTDYINCRRETSKLRGTKSITQLESHVGIIDRWTTYMAENPDIELPVGLTNIFNKGFSGAGLAQKYFLGNGASTAFNPPYQGIKYIQDQNLRLFKHQESKAYVAALRTTGLIANPDWKALIPLVSDPDQVALLVKIGESILKSRETTIARIISTNATTLSLTKNNVELPFVVCPVEFADDVLKQLAVGHHKGFAISVDLSLTSKEMTFELRSTNACVYRMDRIAWVLGGTGLRNTGGFSVDYIGDPIEVITDLMKNINLDDLPYLYGKEDHNEVS